MGTRREALLEAAMLLFSRKGFDGTTITEIEAAVGLTPGTGSFYRHFPSKQAILDAAVEHALRQSMQRQAARRAATPSSERRSTLASQYADVLTLLDDVGPLIDLLTREHGRLPEVAEMLRTGMVDAAVAVEGALATGTTNRQVGTVVMSALVGYHLTVRFFGAPPGDVGREPFVRALAELVAEHAP